MSNYDPNQPPVNPGQQPTDATTPQSQGQYSPPQPQAEVPAQGYTPPVQSTYQQPTPTPTQPVAPAPSKKSNRTPLMIIGGVLLLLLCGCIGLFAFGGAIFGGVMAATQPVADAGERFMVAFRDGNYDSAYNMFTSSLQSEIGGPDRVEGTLQASRPTKWTFNSRSITNNTGQLQGSMTLVDGREADFQLVLENVGGEWKISGIDIDPR